jgi:hypothetical protein
MRANLHVPLGTTVKFHKPIVPGVKFHLIVSLKLKVCGFGGLEVTCWPLETKFAGSNPAETFGFLGRKNPQHAFLGKGSKAVGPMSYVYGI